MYVNGIYSCSPPFEGDMQLYLLDFAAMIEPKKVKNGFLVMIRTSLDLRSRLSEYIFQKLLHECLNDTQSGIVLHEDVNAKIVSMGIEADMPLMHQLMDPLCKNSLGYCCHQEAEYKNRFYLNNPHRTIFTCSTIPREKCILLNYC
jgi:hypothetical protein